MIIFPAIDIRGGRCVRLLKGDFNNITQYKKSPVDQANEFFNLGSEIIMMKMYENFDWKYFPNSLTSKRFITSFISLCVQVYI